MSESSAVGKGSVFLRVLDDLEEAALQAGHTEAARVFATEREAVKAGFNEAEIQASLDRIERFLAVRLEHETLLLAQRIWSRSTIETGPEGLGYHERQYVAGESSNRSEGQEERRRDEASSAIIGARRQRKSVAKQSSSRSEQEKQQRELEAIRRSFAEMGARMGSLFEPSGVEEPKPAPAASSRIGKGEPRDYDRELEEIRRAFAEMGARMGTMLESSSAEQDEPGRSSEEDHRIKAFGAIRRSLHRRKDPAEESRVRPRGQHERRSFARTPRSMSKAVLRWSVNIAFMAIVALLIVLLLQEVGGGQLVGIIATGIVILFYSFGAFPPRLRRGSNDLGTGGPKSRPIGSGRS